MASNADQLNVDSIIERLLGVCRSRQIKNELSEAEMRCLCL